MNEEEISNLIIKELGKHHDRNELIRTVCEQYSLTWPEAEKLIEQVEATHKNTIAAKQSPLLIFVGVGTLIVGLVLVIYNMPFFISFFQRDTLDQLLSLRSGYIRIGGLLTGIGMLVGGFIGLWRTLEPFLKEE